MSAPDPSTIPKFTQHLRTKWLSIVARASVGGLLMIVAVFVGMAFDLYNDGEWSVDQLKLCAVLAVPFGFPSGFLYSLVWQLISWKSLYRPRNS